MSRNALDVELIGEVPVILNIDLSKDYSVIVLLRQTPQNRRHNMAWATPSGPEIHYYRFAAAKNLSKVADGGLVNFPAQVSHSRSV